MIGFVILAIIVVVVLGLVFKLLKLAIIVALVLGAVAVGKKMLGGASRQIK
ncbi:MAG: hypothetical protein ABIP55_06650 [Tepidisphaeraceae bacterium]